MFWAIVHGRMEYPHYTPNLYFTYFEDIMKYSVFVTTCHMVRLYGYKLFSCLLMEYSHFWVYASYWTIIVRGERGVSLVQQLFAMCSKLPVYCIFKNIFAATSSSRSRCIFYLTFFEFLLTNLLKILHLSKNKWFEI